MNHMNPPIRELGALLFGLYVDPRTLKQSAVLKFRDGTYEVWEQHDTGKGQSGGSGSISVVDRAIVQEALVRNYLHEVTENEEPYKPSKSTWYVLTKDRVKLSEILLLVTFWEGKEYGQ